MEVSDASDNVLTVRATKEDFEGIANTYIRKAVKGEPLPVTMKVEDDVVLIFGNDGVFIIHCRSLCILTQSYEKMVI